MSRTLDVVPDYDFPEREAWAAAVAAVVLKTGTSIRDRIADRVTAYGRTLPSDAAALYRRSWWSNALQSDIEPAMRTVAAEAADSFAAATGVELAESERDEIAVAVAATIAALLVNRGDIVANRVETLIARGLEEGWEADRFVEELGVEDPDESGPLSAALLADIGVTAGLSAAFSATMQVAERKQLTGEKEWRTVGDSRVRSTHVAVDGTTVALDEQFLVGGFPAEGPHDPSLPVQEYAGCRCSLVLRVDKQDGASSRFEVLGHSHAGRGLRYENQEVHAVSEIDTTATAPEAAATGEPDGDMAAAEQPDGGALVDVPDADLIAELARRAAERVPADVDPALAEDVMSEAVAEAAEDIVEQATEPAEDDEMPPEVMMDTAPATAKDVTHFTTELSNLRLFGDAEKTAAAAVVTDDVAPAVVDRGTEFAVDGIPQAPAVTEFDGEGIICVEGIMSGDGRMMAEGSLTWRQLPVPLAFLEKITREHQEGEFCGWIHVIERRGAAVWAKFTLEDNAAGNRLREILGNPKGAGRYGVSVDIDAATVVYSDGDGNVMDMIDVQEAAYAGEEVVQLMVEGRIIGATSVMHPAFQEANVWLIDPEQEPTEALAASVGGRLWRTFYNGTDEIGPLRAPGADMEALVASAGVNTDAAAPPARYFDLQPMEEPVAFGVAAPDADGVVSCYGLVAQWGDCHVGYQDRCVTVPRSPDFASFYGTNAWQEFYGGPALSRFYAGNKQVLTREGKLVQVGPVILDTVHPNLRMKASDAQAFYAHTGSAVADVRLYVNEWGIVAAGVIRPDATPAQITKLRASDVSPDWRMLDGELKVMALLAVNVSGFQIEGLAASAGKFQPWAAVDEHSGEVVSLVAAGAMHREPRAQTVAEIALLRAQLAASEQAHADLARRVASLAERLERVAGPIEKQTLQAALATFGR